MKLDTGLKVSALCSAMLCHLAESALLTQHLPICTICITQLSSWQQHSLPKRTPGLFVFSVTSPLHYSS